jgi:acetolactate synthase-1/2/3 large subunit
MAKTERRLSVADYFVSHLESIGVRHIFLLPGGGSMYLVDAIARSKKITAVPMLHEQSAGIAAEAYAQYRNELSVVLVTTGPGGTNAVTPCAAAYTDSTPVLFVSGQVKKSDSRSRSGVRQFGFQEIPITEIVSPITKRAEMVNDPDRFPNQLSEFLASATTGRPGPVWLDIPLDVQRSDIDLGFLELSVLDGPDSLSNDEEIPEDLFEGWISAKRPLLLLGNGVRLGEASVEARNLIQRTQTPTLLTWKMLDLMDDTDPLNAGRPGAIAQRWANLAQQACDFLLVIGARLDTGQTAFNLEGFAPFATKYVIDIDEAELRKFPGDFRTVKSDSQTLISRLLENPKLIGVEAKSSWIKQIEKWKKMYPLNPAQAIDPQGRVNLYEFMESLSRNLGEGAILAPGSSGACSEVTMQAFRVKLGQRVYNSEGLGSMGFGIPGAIGASLASGGKKVICVDGDGGFAMNIQELATVRHLGLPIKFFVLNNSGYGSIRKTQDVFFEGRRLGIDAESGLGIPDLQNVSTGFQIQYSKIANGSELDFALEKTLSSEYPEIIEVMVELDHSTKPRVASHINLNGEIVSNPMHCLSDPIEDEDFFQLTGLSTNFP